MEIQHRVVACIRQLGSEIPNGMKADGLLSDYGADRMGSLTAKRQAPSHRPLPPKKFAHTIISLWLNLREKEDERDFRVYHDVLKIDASLKQECLKQHGAELESTKLQ